MDWNWVIGLAITALVGGLAKLNHRVSQLEKQVKKDKILRDEPFPSDDAEEMIAVRAAKELCKKMGDKFTFEQAYKAVRKVRDTRKAKGASTGGNSDKRTA